MGSYSIQDFVSDVITCCSGSSMRQLVRIEQSKAMSITHCYVYCCAFVRGFPVPGTESSKYYARPQTAVAHGLGWPASHLMGLYTATAPKHYTATAPKHYLCFSVQFPSNLVTCIDIHLQIGDVSVYWLWLLLDISAVSVVIVIIAICDMPRQEFSLRKCVYIHNTYMKSRKSCSETQHKFQIKFPGRPVSNPSTIRRLAKWF